MFVRAIAVFFCATVLYFACASSEAAAQQQAYGRQWGRTYSIEDWNRYYHYPYKYYPQNYQSQDYYRAMSNPGQQYPKEMQIPAQYDKSWQNYFPVPRKYHFGRHFNLDIL